MNKTEQMNKNLYDYIRMHAQKAPQSAFLIGESSYTYGEALQRIQALMNMFAANGVKKGDLVAIRMTRTPECVLLTVALGAIGAVSVMTDCHNTVEEFLCSTNTLIRPAFTVTDEEGGWRLFKDGGEEEISFSDGADAAAAEELRSHVLPDDPFMIIFTSGSTGKSKAVTLSHKNCIANPVDAMPLFEEDERDVAVSLLPLHHVFGFAVIACTVFCGHSVVFPREIDPRSVLSCIEKYHISVIYSVPTLFKDLLADGLHREYDISSLRLGLMAGGPFTEQQMLYIENELGLKLMPGYGMSECLGISTMRYRDSVEERAAGVGRLYPMAKVCIFDENDREVPLGQEGEICAKAPTMMLGYYGDEELTARVIDGNGWIHTGDLGYMDERGILHISGRKKDLIIRNGNNLSPVTIERKMLSLPNVNDVCVVGIKDEREGEVPAAAVVLAEGGTLSEADLASVLYKMEIPKKIKFVKAIPLTSSSKPDKPAVRLLMQD